MNEIYVFLVYFCENKTVSYLFYVTLYTNQLTIKQISR